jgi:hypothetical protein
MSILLVIFEKVVLPSNKTHYISMVCVGLLTAVTLYLYLYLYWKWVLYFLLWCVLHSWLRPMNHLWNVNKFCSIKSTVICVVMLWTSDSLMFQRNILTPSSGLQRWPHKKPAEACHSLPPASWLAYFSTLTMEAICSSEMPGSLN